MERTIESKEILRRTRVAVAPYLTEVRRRSRAILPRMEIRKRWIGYYEDLAKIRDLTPKEQRTLQEHRENLEFFEARIDLFSQMARYARKPSPATLTALRLAQTRYYEEKADVALPREAERIREEILPPPELYEEWSELVEDIRKKCRRYKRAKYWEEPLLTGLERYFRMTSLGEALRADFAKGAELAKSTESLPSIAKEYYELKGGTR